MGEMGGLESPRAEACEDLEPLAQLPFRARGVAGEQRKRCAHLREPREREAESELLVRGARLGGERAAALELPGDAVQAGEGDQHVRLEQAATACRSKQLLAAGDRLVRRCGAVEEGGAQFVRQPRLLLMRAGSAGVGQRPLARLPRDREPAADPVRARGRPQRERQARVVAQLLEDPGRFAGNRFELVERRIGIADAASGRALQRREPFGAAVARCARARDRLVQQGVRLRGFARRPERGRPFAPG